MNHNEQPVKIIKTEESGKKDLKLIVIGAGNPMIDVGRIANQVNRIKDEMKISVAFHIWCTQHEWEHDYREQRTLTTEQLFDIFIKEYKP